MDRLYSIAIGGFVGVLVNVLAFPIWSGEQLHNELVSSFNSVADSLEGKIIILYMFVISMDMNKTMTKLLEEQGYQNKHKN